MKFTTTSTLGAFVRAVGVFALFSTLDIGSGNAVHGVHAVSEHGSTFSQRKFAELSQAARAKHHAERARSAAVKSWAAVNTSSPTITFSDPRAQAFYVNGTSIPDVGFDVGPSWSGLIPISADPNETRKLFFWFFPSKDAQYTDDLVFWTNGGPGCSSMIGLLQENGPFKWPHGTAGPTINQWSWTNLSHVLWVEQPVGTGFSQGTPNITNENELAAQAAGFLTQFLDIFKELSGKNFYISGESYAGFYVPYIANYLFEHPGLVNLTLKGTWTADAVWTSDLINSEVGTLRYVDKWKSVFGFNSTFFEHLTNVSQKCGYSNYLAEYVHYPPNGTIPLPQRQNGTNADECDIWNEVVNEAFSVNPNFNFYRILDTWPVLWDVLGFPGSNFNAQSEIYFNRRDVQEAIHAPPTNWTICSNIDVFVNGSDNSVPSMLSVMPNVIEKSAKTIVTHGLVDFILLAEGTRIAIQNMTWNGLQGFQSPIPDESFSFQGFGVIGNVHEERNLTYVEVNLSGHELPGYAPWAGYKTLWYLLGRGPLNSTAIDASLYPDAYQLYGPYGGGPQ